MSAKSKLQYFRDIHECKYCKHYKRKCLARYRCIYDYLPYESSEDEILLFQIKEV